MRQISYVSCLLLSGALLVPGVAPAATITGWITDNVDVGPVDDNPNDDVGGASVVYDRDPAEVGANSNGQIVYIAPESNTPGVKIEGGEPLVAGSAAEFPYTGTKNQEFDGCIMASSEAYCNSEFQSGKRIKQQVTSPGTIDLVFGVADTTPDSDDASIYQVFHRLINVTGAMLDGFTVELGIGVGGDFVSSTDDDGLRFATDVRFGPDNLSSFSQYPYGLFGGEPLNPNPLELKGFFDTSDPGRAGFEVTQTEDKIQSGDYYGIYDDMFSNWLSQDMVPEGLFWDYDPGNADPLLMAWLNDDGMWELRRDIADGVLGEDGSWNPDDIGPGDVLSLMIADDWELFEETDVAGVADFLGLGELLMGPIEDLANLNLSFAIEVADSFISSWFGDAPASFTMRVNTTAVAPVPLPAGMPLLIAGLGALGLAARNRRKTA